MGAPGELAEGALRAVEDPDVHRRRRAREDHRELRPVGGEGEAGGDLRRQRGPERLRPVARSTKASSLGPRRSRRGGGEAGVVDLEGVELGVVARGDDLDRARPAVRGEADPGERGEVAAGVRGEPDRPSVGREDAAAEARRPLVRRQEELGARLEVDEEEVVVAPLHQAGEEREATVAGDVGVAVAAGARSSARAGSPVSGSRR